LFVPPASGVYLETNSCTSSVGKPLERHKPSLRLRYKQLLSKALPYAGGTNSCFSFWINSLHWRYKELPFKSTPYAGGTSLRWWYNPTLI